MINTKNTLQTLDMVSENPQDSMKDFRQVKPSDNYLLEGVIWVNQNLPSVGSSSPDEERSRRGSFTMEEDEPWTANRKFSFEMMDVYNHHLKETPNSNTLQTREPVNLIPAKPETKELTRARSESILSLYYSESQESLEKPHHSSGECKEVPLLYSGMIESMPAKQPTPKQKRHITNPSLENALDPDSHRANAGSTHSTQQQHAHNQLEEILPAMMTHDQSNMLIEAADHLYFDCFDLEEQINLAYISIPEGKNGSRFTYLSFEEHLDIHQEHDLQPNQLGTCVQNHLCSLRIGNTE
jgi:hypothetical protein